MFKKSLKQEKIGNLKYLFNLSLLLKILRTLGCASWNMNQIMNVQKGNLIEADYSIFVDKEEEKKTEKIFEDSESGKCLQYKISRRGNYFSEYTDI